MRINTVLLLICAALASCAEKKVDMAGARLMADARFKAHAMALGASLLLVPEPSIQDRADGFVFVYELKANGKKVTVIVDRNGRLADTVD